MIDFQGIDVLKLKVKGFFELALISVEKKPSKKCVNDNTILNRNNKSLRHEALFGRRYTEIESLLCRQNFSAWRLLNPAARSTGN
ncbi:MAG: hypothetical protein PSU93_10580 [Methylobacter sp.]|uniref:Uncharacterized protein n=1 Tax=Candidatus Methylobacter titanis TaxID=3053457 RepID=A0AA43Q6E9_9GAMM|nr:hypothetical protein [Candidatus Methylobacter titanis]